MALSVLSKSLIFVKKYWAILLIATALISGIDQALNGSLNEPIAIPEKLTPYFVGYSLLKLLAGILVTTAFYGFIALLAFRDSNNEDIDIAAIAKHVLSRLPKLVGISVAASIVIVVGIFLLLIPGLVFAVWFFLAIPVGVIENANISGALSRSRELVRENFWKVLLVIILPILPLAVIEGVVPLLVDGSTASAAASYIAGGLMTLAFATLPAYLYLELAKNKAPQAETPTADEIAGEDGFMPFD